VQDDIPIPITVPYSAWVSSALATGEKARRARRETIIREREERMRRECVCVSRRDMVVSGI
jgi:hypothetical protein